MSDPSVSQHPTHHHRTGRLPRLLALLLALCIVSAPAGAGGQAEFGDLRVHYSAVPTANLSEAIASQYGIPRSRLSALVLISVLRDGNAIAADVRGETRDRRERTESLRFRELDAGGYVSYVALARIESGEALTFDLSIRAGDADQRHRLRFRENFVVD